MLNSFTLYSLASLIKLRCTTVVLCWCKWHYTICCASTWFQCTSWSWWLPKIYSSIVFNILNLFMDFMVNFILITMHILLTRNHFWSSSMTFQVFLGFSISYPYLIIILFHVILPAWINRILRILVDSLERVSMALLTPYSHYLLPMNITGSRIGSLWEWTSHLIIGLCYPIYSQIQSMDVPNSICSSWISCCSFFISICRWWLDPIRYFHRKMGINGMIDYIVVVVCHWWLNCWDSITC